MASTVRRPRRWLATVAAACLALVAPAVLAGCTGDEPAGGAPPGPLTGTLTVLASTSLTEALTRLAMDFESTYPRLDVKVAFGPDSELVRRAMTGTPADVLLVEGPRPLAQLGSAGGAPVVFARNQLVVAIAPGNPKGLGRLDDLIRPGLRVVLCAVAEPCGAASAAVLRAAGVTLASAARVPDVRAALATVERGEADAALVYRSDTRTASDRVDTLEFAQSRQSLAEYQAVAMAGAPNRDAARAFLSFLVTTPAQNVLMAAGLQSPS